MKKTKLKPMKIGQLLNLKRGYDLTKNEMTKGAIPVVGSNGIIGFHNVSNCKSPCVTVGRSGTVGATHLYKQDCWIHNTCLYVDDFKGNDPLYIFYLLKVLNLEKFANSTSTPTLNRNFIHPLKINAYTDIKEQQKIGRILSSIDDKIAINNQINAILERVAKAIYEYYFVQFDFPDKQGKPYKSSGGTMRFDPTLNRPIPKDFEVKYMKDFLNVITGKEDANFATQNGEYAFFTCGDEILKCNQSAFSGKAILIAGNGNFNVKYFDGKFNAYQRTYVLIPKNELYVGILYLSALARISAFTKGSNGSIVKFITKGDIENIPVIVPNNTDILHIFNLLLTKQNQTKLQNQKLKNLRDFLLPLLINAQVQIQQPKIQPFQI